MSAANNDEPLSLEGLVFEAVTVVEQGNVSRKLDMGNEETKLALGNYSIDVAAGAVEISAMQSITLKVGTSKIVLDQSGVTIDGIMIAVTGVAKVDVGAPLTTVKADGIASVGSIAKAVFEYKIITHTNKIKIFLIATKKILLCKKFLFL